MNDWYKTIAIIIFIIASTMWFHISLVRERYLRQSIENKIDEKIEKLRSVKDDSTL